MNERQINQSVAEQICRTSRWNGTQFQQGECVALLDGNVVAVARDLHAALNALRALDADPERGMILEVAPPIVDLIR